MFDSKKYWEKRYLENGTSGNGSYGVLAEFKAEVVNGLIRQHGIRSVVDLGVGDGNQLKLLGGFETYLGVDVSPTVIKKCKRLFPQYQFRLYDPGALSKEKFDLALSLDVLYHLVEDDAYWGYMNVLFSVADYVCAYTMDFEKPGFSEHVRPRKFTEDAKRFGYDLIQHIPQRHYSRNHAKGSQAEFFVYKKQP